MSSVRLYYRCNIRRRYRPQYISIYVEQIKAEIVIRYRGVYNRLVYITQAYTGIHALVYYTQVEEGSIVTQ